MRIHLALIAAIRRAHIVKPLAEFTSIENQSDEEIIRAMFSNYRGFNVPDPEIKGLQLSVFGLYVMQNFFRSWTVEFQDQFFVTAKHYLYLDRATTMPWYISTYPPVSIVFFEPDLAMKAKLVGDLNLLPEAFQL